MILFADLETFSETPITHGTHKYAEKAEVLLWAYAFDDEPAIVWDVTLGDAGCHYPTFYGMPPRLRAALCNPNVTTVWHNGGMFDLIVLQHAMGIDIPLERVHDTMVQALSHSLPGSLGDLCSILGVDVNKAKDKDGRRLILKFCKNRNTKISAFDKQMYEAGKIDLLPATHRNTRETHPVDWEKFMTYARLDVEAMREVYRKLPKWNMTSAEVDLWRLDQRINRRGMCVDLDLAKAAVTAIDLTQKQMAKRTQEITDGAVASTTQRDVLLRHVLSAYGVDLPDMTQSTLERRLNDPDLPVELRELLAIRLQASTTSTAKYKRLLETVSADGRLRGTLQFNGASRTGRWAGRLFQPQNLPKPTMPASMIDLGIDALKAGAADLIFPDVMALTSNAIRGCIVAPTGRKLVAADLSNIEGRMLAWLAGEEWKLQAFRDFDAGEGPDIYKLAYAKSFGIRPDDVTKDQRQVGKVQELALGYGGGVGAFVTFAAAYGIDLAEMADAAVDMINPLILNEARSLLAWTKLNRRPTYGLSDRTWLVCDSFKRAWRNAHPKVVYLWSNLESAAQTAFYAPGKAVPVGDWLKVQRDGSWLRIRLPSGRCLCYPGLRVDSAKITESENYSRTAHTISYMGVNQYTRQWGRITTYGGKCAENGTQAASRDVLAHGMMLADAAGYMAVTTIHDEAVCETPDSTEFSSDALVGLMSVVPSWAAGLPLAAKGFEAQRYQKD